MVGGSTVKVLSVGFDASTGVSDMLGVIAGGGLAGVEVDVAATGACWLAPSFELLAAGVIPSS